MRARLPHSANLGLAALLIAGCAGAPHRITNRPVTEPPSAESRWNAAATRWRYHQLASADGEIHSEALLRAREQLAARRSVASAPAAASTLQWTFRGPDNVGGRTRSLVIDPRNANVLYAAAVTGGIWKSTDAGAHWTPLADFLPSLNANALALDPQAPDTLYVGTGEGYFWGLSNPGVGVLRSDDGGATWQHLPATASWKWVNRIAISPADRNLIVVAGDGGVRRSTDRGATWTTVRAATTAWDLQVDPTNPGLWLATTFDRKPGQNLGGIGTGLEGTFRILRSTTAGASWATVWTPQSLLAASEVTRDTGRIDVAFTHSGSGIVYALGWFGGNVSLPGHVVLESTDHGATFTRVDSAWRDQDGQPFDAPGVDITSYHLFLWVSPTDDNLLLGGGLKVSRSLDGGRTWEAFQHTGGHFDLHAAVNDPGYNGTTNRRVYLLSDGGIHRLNDLLAPPGPWGIDIEDLNHGYETTQFYGACGHAAGPGLVGGTQDNAFGYIPGGSLESTYFDISFWGDGGQCSFDPASPGRFYATDTLAYGIARGDATRLNPAGNPSMTDVRGDIPSDEGSAWDPPLVLDPNDGRRLWIPLAHLWRTDNARDTSSPHWQALFEPTIVDPFRSYLVSMAVAPGDSNRVWVGLADGRILRTADALASAPHWRSVDDNATLNPLPNRTPTSIAFDRVAANTVYVGFGGFDADNLYRTQDGGSTWQPVTGSGALALPAVPVLSFAQHPTVPSWWFVGTEIGVFASYDAGKSWVQTPSGLPDVIVDDLRFEPQSNTLLAGTFGRGLWSLDTTSLLPDGSCQPDGSTLCLSHGRFLVHATWNDGQGHAGDASAVGLTPDTGYFWFFDSANVELVVKVLDACGVAGSPHFWVFASGLTDRDVEILVLDTLTGAARTYRNPAGQPFAPIQDTAAFATCGAARSIRSAPVLGTVAPDDSLPPAATGESATCSAGPNALCLNNGRFRVVATWTTPQGQHGAASAVALSPDTGYLWFFDPSNVEVVVKVLDACGISAAPRYWVFAAGLTNLDVQLTVTDTANGTAHSYHNAQSLAFRPVLDTNAFATCP